jgi:hypothetical protein
VKQTQAEISTILGNPSIDCRTDLRYVMRLYLEQFNAGISRSYVDEFIDESAAVQTFGTNGLLQNDLTPKPAYTGSPPSPPRRATMDENGNLASSALQWSSSK